MLERDQMYSSTQTIPRIVTKNVRYKSRWEDRLEDLEYELWQRKLVISRDLYLGDRFAVDID
jgi:hypothetical protein